MIVKDGKIVGDNARQTDVMYTMLMVCNETGEKRLYIGTQEGIDLMIYFIIHEKQTWEVKIDYVKKNQILFEVKT